MKIYKEDITLDLCKMVENIDSLKPNRLMMYKNIIEEEINKLEELKKYKKIIEKSIDNINK